MFMAKGQEAVYIIGPGYIFICGFHKIPQPILSLGQRITNPPGSAFYSLAKSAERSYNSN